MELENDMMLPSQKQMVMGMTPRSAPHPMGKIPRPSADLQRPCIDGANRASDAWPPEPRS
jgi:hypothetical protein